MGKKKKHSGGGGGGGQQQNPAADASAAAEEGEERAVAATTGASGDAAAREDNKDKESNDKGKDQGGKDKGKKPPPPLPVVTAVLKVDMHCDGCAKRIRASVHRYAGVEGVAMEVDKGSMTVVGRFDAKKLRDRVANKTRKKVDLVGNNNAGSKGGGGGGNNKGGGGNQHKGASEEDGKPEKGHDGDKEDKGKDKDDHQEGDKGKDGKGGGSGGGGKGKGGGAKDNKKPAVPVIGTVVLKIGSTGLHCEGCMDRIRHKLFKIKGVEQVKMDMAKNQVTVTGTMDTKAVPEELRKKLRRPVDVVPAKDGKDKDGKQQEGGGKDKDKDGKEKDGGKDAATKKLTAELEAWKAAFYDQQSLANAEFMLSDENPNACAVM